MRTSGLLLIAGFAVAVPLAAPADAGVLFAGPLVNAAPSSLSCSILNVGDQPRDIDIDILDTAGNVVGGSTPQVLAPRASFSVSLSSGTFPFPASCRFVVEGGKNSFRANACVIGTGGYQACVPAQ